MAPPIAAIAMINETERFLWKAKKNLHASIPTALLVEAQQAASAERISVDELVRDAVKRRLRERRRQNLYAYGEQQARKLGIEEEDVDRIIHEFRREERERQNNEDRL